jgi:hypothetical protein
VKGFRVGSGVIFAKVVCLAFCHGVPVSRQAAAQGSLS